MPMPKILLAEDDEIMRITVYDRLVDNDWEVDQAVDGAEALALLDRGRYHVVVSDIRMPGLDGVSLMEKARERNPETEVVLMTAYGSVDSAVECLRKGAADYILKPFDLDDLTIRISRLLEKQMMQARCIPFAEHFKRNVIIGSSAVMQQMQELISRVAATDATVLICGESGTGKELVAAALHNRGHRADGPYIKINCAAIPETLIESELFGHEKGAFTGAQVRKIGKFELADRGTILLDEIGDMPLNLQAKLLRVLQEKEVERIGGKRTIPVDVRVVCSSAKDLEEEIEAGNFRKDLLYRLKVVPIKAPALWERKEDIPELCEHFLKEFSADRGLALSLSREALTCLMAYDFPGNIRELRNILERAAVLSPEALITPADLPLDIIGEKQISGECEKLSEAVARAEKECITKALAQCEGNKAEAAKILGISRKNLWEKIRNHGMD